MEKYMQFILATIVCLCGLALCFVGIYCDPRGEIDPTALVALGESLTFAGAVVGVDYHYRFKDNE